MTRRPWSAYFESDCEACGRQIHPGDDAIWNDHHQIVHLACTDEPTTERPAHV